MAFAVNHSHTPPFTSFCVPVRRALVVVLFAPLLLMLNSCGSGKQAAEQTKDAPAAPGQHRTVELLNVSYDPTRELFEAYNRDFARRWAERTGDTVNVLQSHGGSGKQSRSVIDGLAADVVTLALAYDIDAIASHGELLPADWQSKLPSNSTPYTSTIVFLVRKGNPKGIKDWDDLVRSDVSVITPNPKTSGAARWSYLAAWAYAAKKFSDEEQRRSFIGSLYAHVPVLDTGARGSAITFMERGMGDVLLTWENEAFLAMKDSSGKPVEIVYPSMSILAEPAVAVVEKNATRKDTLEIAKAYLEGLYTPEAQALAAEHGYRPSAPEIAAKYEKTFPKLPLVTIAEMGGWAAMHTKHFADGALFDQLYKGNS